MWEVYRASCPGEVEPTPICLFLSGKPFNDHTDTAIPPTFYTVYILILHLACLSLITPMAGGGEVGAYPCIVTSADILGHICSRPTRKRSKRKRTR
ncbi:hypothetical protein BDN72DRAFT_388591 [Pluteus cervinus]|uniref:Uncharacterized protein n=1 Tax=Pluteus cervinus TaxID=181527 RepID=A0ACD3B204_9AGAR|nr:hypothetical protein BDN72DRAFT_388591 [Pluteus cervinus]